MGVLIVESMKWKNSDTATRMTQKYNSLVSSVDSIADDVARIPSIETSIDDVNDRVDSVSKTDVGLGNVDNTSDADKPVSTLQAQAIRWAKEEAMEDMLTSQPLSGSLDGDAASFITNIGVSGTKLIISM